MHIIRRLISEHRIPQILLLGLLTLGILIRPVLFSLGEIHELQHDSKVAILHADFGTSYEENVQYPNEDDQVNTTTLHALTHFAHNCDQPTCAETGCFVSVGAALSSAHIPALGDSPRKSIIPSAFFRPPITV